MTFWQISLACFLAVYGLVTVSNFRFDGTNVVLGILAIITAILLIAKK